jgi:hypothetical protein
VRVYHDRTKVFVPTHYVARERLCLSAAADDWINAMDGKRFIGVHQAVDPALLQCFERDYRPAPRSGHTQRARRRTATLTLRCTASPLCLIGRLKPRVLREDEEAAHCLPDLSHISGRGLTKR